MPYRISKRGGKHRVVKKGTGETAGKKADHSSRAAAVKQLVAIKKSKGKGKAR
ncbi:MULTISPECIES: hypothetical protein [unclassified Frankia]|uniref:hypothetical protein n=1 Tax=unclassified Frankia TaxID=2632575 RepID=UPI000A5F0A55|nr:MULTISPECIES: hypothetical protein [unclassified Frankia]